MWAPEVRQATDNADFARRAQLMLFSALASMDGWNTGFVPWNSSVVDRSSEAMFVRYAQERAKLQPFLLSAYRRQSQTGVPVARSVIIDYDNATEFYTTADQYLLGDGLLVAPVVEVGALNRSVAFPPGNDWVDYWSPSTKYAGGTRQTVSA
eukprot:SAG25_NODE_4927_length_730_cov_1.156894_1_plen_152_part_00